MLQKIYFQFDKGQAVESFETNSQVVLFWKLPVPSQTLEKYGIHFN